MMKLDIAERETGVSAAPPPGYLRSLAPLSAEEILMVVGVIKADAELGPGALYETIELKEPTPEAFRAAVGGKSLAGSAIDISHKDRPGVWKMTVSIGEKRILTKKHYPTMRPAVQVEQLISVQAVVKADPRFIEACRKRGITNMDGVCVDAWTGGNFGFEDEKGRLISHTFSWLRTSAIENFYAHPIEGLNAVVDIKTGEVLRVDDHGGPPIPMTEINYDADLIATRKPLKPLDVVQPEGVSFTMDGHAIAWDKWTLAIGFNPRDGLILHDIRYDGRPIVRRAALAELVVPYGMPERGHYRENIFDIGEYGFGKFTNSLKLGCDCLGTIHYLDAHLNTLAGDVFTIQKAICIHEEDAGVLWKHWDFRIDRTELRRGRKLVISCINTVGNYEYAQYWYFTQAGEMEFEVKATGIANTNACEPGKPGKYAAEFAPGLSAPIHQHIFCARLDMAVDGHENSVVEVNSQAEAVGPGNPHGCGFYATETVLEKECGRDVNLDTHRYWKVVNGKKLNHVGRPVGYKLHADSPVKLMIAPDGPSGVRSSFARHQVWVTPFAEDERYPGGEFVCNSDGHDSLAELVKQGRSVVNTDVVLWHCFGLHHVARPEDFPVQPCLSAGFMLSPSGFFNLNPSNDLPRGVNKASKLAGEAGGCCGGKK